MSDPDHPVYLISVGDELTERQLEHLTKTIQSAFEDAGFDDGQVVVMCAGELTPMDREDLREVLGG